MIKAIVKAIKGGYNRYDGKGGWGDGHNVECAYEMLLDPLFWQALGREEGWRDGDFVDYGDGHSLWSNSWQHVWHQFIDHLAENKPIDDFFNNLIK